MSKLVIPIFNEESYQYTLTATFQCLLSNTWREREESWFYAYLQVLFWGFSHFLLKKQHLMQRFKVRSFIAIDVALTILEVFRSLLILLDPWIQSRFCNNLVSVIVRRSLWSLAFPCLTTSYTLAFINFWICAQFHLRTPWIPELKVLVSLCFGFGAVFEIVAALYFNNPMDEVILLLVCKVMITILTIRGFLVCLLFGVSGLRLLRMVRKTAKSNSMIRRDSSNMNHHKLIKKSRFHNRSVSIKTKYNLKMQRIARGQQKKSLSKILYITILLGIVYSLLGLLNLVAIFWTVLDGLVVVINDQAQYPELPLTMQQCLLIFLGILLVVLFTIYYTPLANFVKEILRFSQESRKSPSPIRNKTTFTNTHEEQLLKTSPDKNSVPRNWMSYKNNSVKVLYSLSTNYIPRSPSPLLVSVRANGNGSMIG